MRLLLSARTAASRTDQGINVEDARRNAGYKATAASPVAHGHTAGLWQKSSKTSRPRAAKCPPPNQTRGRDDNSRHGTKVGIGSCIVHPIIELTLDGTDKAQIDEVDSFQLRVSSGK